MFKKFTLCAVLIVAPFFATAKPTENSVRTLLEVSGSSQMGQQMFDQMMIALKPMMGEVDETFFAELQKEVDMDSLLNQLIPVYQSHLSQNEIDQLIAFYQSDIGKRLVEVQPALTQESFMIGQKWGQELGMKVHQKIQSLQAQ